MTDAEGGLRSTRFGSDVTGGLRELAHELNENRRSTTLAILAALQAQIVEELSTPGKGRQRRIAAARGRRHTAKARAKALARAGQASAPGDPPAPDTGQLRGSIQIEYDNAARKGRVGTNLVYAAPLNFGTVRAGKSRRGVILPRPFMEPALKKAGPAMTAAGALSLRLTVRPRVLGGAE